MKLNVPQKKLNEFVNTFSNLKDYNHSSLKIKQLIALLFLISFVFTSNIIYGQSTPKTIYVDSSNTEGIKDGTTWATAYSSFESAIYNNLNIGDTIFVAKGTYTPSIQGNSFFISVGNLHIYGGFPSGGGTLQDRVWEADSTILRPKGHSVLYLDDTYKTTINGFYITGGNGMWGGGGIFNNAANNTFENLVVYENTAGMAGGMYNDHGGYNVTLNNVAFKNNQSIYENAWGSGGGLYNSADNLKITNCLFENNHAEGTYGANGGGIHNVANNLTILNTDFIGNSAFCEDGFTVGGAINNSGNNFELKNCNFEQNSVNTINQNGKGGAIRHEGENMVINNCTFSENEISSDLENVNGGALAIEGQNPSMIFILNSSFNENKATSQTNHADGGAIDINGLSSSKVSIINTVFTNNLATAELSRATGGAIVVEGVFLSLTNVDFIENSAVSNSDHARGGAINNTGNAQLSINKALFEGNSASGKINPTLGGAMFNSGGNITVNNTVFTNNSTLSTQGESYGGALALLSGQNTITNSTFTSNTANGNVVLGGAIASTSLVSENNIFWNNQLNGDLTNGDITSLGSLTINHSFTQTDFTSIGTGNILGTTSPFIDFDNPAGADGVWGTLDDGIYPICGSPVIDAGNNNALDPSVTHDFAGMMRYKSTVDMGAYEYHGIIQTIDSAAFCPPNSYTWNGEDYSEAGVYTVVTGTDTEGCELVDALVLSTTNSLLITAVPQNNNICINTAFTFISHQTSNVSEIYSYYGLPDGVTAQYSNNAIVLSGTPTEAGVFTYLLSVKGCGEEWITGHIKVLPVGQVTELSNNPLEICKNNFFFEEVATITNLQEILSFDGLPNGLEPYFSGSELIFIGVPAETGVFNYSVTFSGCENVVFQGELTVVDDNIVQELNTSLVACVNTPLEETTHLVSGIMTGIESVSGLPQGLTFSYENNQLILSGTPTEIGTFNYTVTPQKGCDEIYGSVVIHGPAEVFGATQYPTTCVNYGMTDIFHFINHVAEIGSVNNLPNGVTVELLEDVIKISGTPTEVGTFNYTITLIGGCDEVTATGTITVQAQPTLAQNLESTTCFGVAMDNLTINGTGLTTFGSSIGLPQGLSASLINGNIVISGTPTESGSFLYEISAHTACQDMISTGTIYVTPNYTVSNLSPIEELCVNTQMTPIIHTTNGVDAIDNITGLPNGVTTSLSNGVLVISGIPTEVGTFNYSISFDSQLCGNATAQGQIIVKEALQVDLGEDMIFCEGEDISFTLDAGFGDSFIWNTGEDTQTIEVSDAGLYSVTVYTNNGCSSMAEMEVILNNSPTVSITLIDDNTLKANAQYVNYQWINCDTEEIISGANNSVFIPTENGNYAVVVTSQSGCENISECIAVTTVNLNAEEWNKLVVYPNPTKNLFTIDFGKSIDQAKISLQDLTGKVLFTETIHNTESFQANSAHLAKGVYLVSIELKNKEKKIIKIIKD